MRRISSELGVPEPARSRILLEMAGDLEALYDHHRARGLSEEEAARQAEEQVLASPETLRTLVEVHTTGYQRWLTRAAGRLRWGFDALLFTLGVVPLVAIAALAVAGSGMGASAPPMLWPILAIGTTIAGITLWKAHQLLLRRQRSAAELHRGLFPLLFLGAVGPVLAGITFLLSLHDLAIGLMRAGAGEPVLLLAAQRMVHDAALLSVALLLGIGAGVVWFVLVNRISVLEQEESAALLALEA